MYDWIGDTKSAGVLVVQTMYYNSPSENFDFIFQRVFFPF